VIIVQPRGNLGGTHKSVGVLFMSRLKYWSSLGYDPKIWGLFPRRSHQSYGSFAENAKGATNYRALLRKTYPVIQGGEDAYDLDALSCRSLSAEEPPWPRIGLLDSGFCGKWPLTIRYPMGLRHPVLLRAQVGCHGRLQVFKLTLV